ncbi:MAG TPA: tyrosine-type recombinase/integrase [Dehalococcoidia bacterium]|nr:tyrosine-type recombinase/integrase [Dehalococcoidia bacterium]
MQLDKALLAYEIDLRAENKSPQTVRWYRHKLHYFAEWLAHGDIGRVEDLEPGQVKGFFLYLAALDRALGEGAHLKNGKPSSLTVHGYARAIKAFCRWLVRNGYLERSPFEGVGMPKVERYVIQAFTEEDVRKMLRAAQGRRHAARDYALVLLLFDTAIRAGELVRLRLEDADFEGGWLRVFGKGARERMVPMGQTAKRALWRYVTLSRPEPLLPTMREVFLNERREPLTGSGVWRVVREVAEAAGVNGKRLSPHTMRHAAAEAFLRNGGDAFALQKLLGHSSLTVTRMYVDLVARDLQDAHRRASPGDNLRVRQRV